MANQLRLKFMFSCFGKLFISGKKVKGVLKVFLMNDARIKRIKIGVIGKINIVADENGNNTSLEEIFYCSPEHIFDASNLTINEEYDEQLLEYSVPLENNLPSSTVFKEGSVEYYLYATMEEDFADGSTQTVNCRSNISVVSLVDCNTIPKAAKEKVVLTTMAKSCFCIQEQEQHDSLQISPRAYVPGDCIKINAVVFNAESCPLQYVQVALIQKVKLKFEDRTVKARCIVSETKRGCLMPGNVQVWHDEFLRIPPLPCTTYHKYLQISYKLQLIPVKAHADLSNAKPLLVLPVVIGNLPLESRLTYFNPLPRCESFADKILPIPEPYQDYARPENSSQQVEGCPFVPSYITYNSEHGMENVELA